MQDTRQQRLESDKEMYARRIQLERVEAEQKATEAYKRCCSVAVILLYSMFTASNTSPGVVCLYFPEQIPLVFFGGYLSAPLCSEYNSHVLLEVMSQFSCSE